MPIFTRTFSLIALFFLAACSSSPTTSGQEERAAESTDQCLANPALAKTWGECNVKTTIFRRADAIGQCQAKHVKSKTQGETLMLKIRLRPNGKVRNVWAEDGSAKNKPLEKCLSQQISRLRFAAPPKGVDPVIYFPFQQ